jgi:methane monooxygenase component A beta chain
VTGVQTCALPIFEIRKDLPSRRLDQQRQLKFYVVPGGSRLTEYEALTMYAQQGTDWASGGLEIGDSMQKWPGGRPTYAPETTEVKTTDWWRFRDPDGRWFFPNVKNKAEEGRVNHRFMQSYSADGTIRMMDPAWLRDVLPDYYGAFLFNEYGLFNAHASVVHDCLSDIVRVFFSNIAFDKADAAQLVQTQRLFMHKLVAGLPQNLDGAKQVWLTAREYAGARRAVEQLWESTFDHIEAVWAIHAVYDPLFGQYVRREFFQHLGPQRGDTLTPWFVAQMIGFHHYAARGVKALCCDALLDDPEYGDMNRRWLHVWTRKWLGFALPALRDFVGMHARVGAHDPAAVRAGVERVAADWVQDFAAPIGYRVDAAQLVDAVLGSTDNSPGGWR